MRRAPSPQLRGMRGNTMKRLFDAPLLALLAIVAALSFTVVSGDARSRGSMGSRGSRTFSMPSGTATAPRANTIERSTTLPNSGGFNQGAGYRPGGFFGGGLLGG